MTTTDSTFIEDVLKSDIPVLVDFWAPWCAPCRTLGPVIDELELEYEGRAKILKLDIDENPEMSELYKIKAIPSIRIFNKGILTNEIVGVSKINPKKQLSNLLDSILNSA